MAPCTATPMSSTTLTQPWTSRSQYDALGEVICRIERAGSMTAAFDLTFRSSSLAEANLVASDT